MRIRFAIYQQNKSVCLNWDNKIFRNFLSSLLVLVYLCSVYMANLYGYLYLFEKKSSAVNSKDNQRKWKNCVSDSGKYWKIVFAVFRYFFIFTMFCFASIFFFSFYLRGRGFELKFITTLTFNTQPCSKSEKAFKCITFGVFVSNHWKVFFCLISTKISGRWPQPKKIFANDYW